MTENEILEKLKNEFGTDFRISIHENSDDDEVGRIVMALPSGRYRAISISLEEFKEDYETALNKFRPIFNYMVGKGNK